MGFLSKLFGKKEEKQVEEVKPTVKKTGGVSIDLNKIAERSGKVQISLDKKGVSELTSEVKLVLDRSISMDRDYSSGKVQEVVERLVPIAMQFDDNGEMEVFTFSNSYEEQVPVTVDNLNGYVSRMKSKRGGTAYAPVIKAITEQARRGEINYPAYVIFITDGENSDESATEMAIREASKYEIYFQFVGIGSSSFRFLKRLDDLKGRKFDNAGFFAIDDMTKVDEGALYDELIDEFVDAYKAGQFASGQIVKK